MTPTTVPSRRRNAFTLIELLAVIAVIAVVVAFAVPATNQILRGSQLTQGQQMVADQISLGRQLALSRNRTIEVRFYQFGDPETPGEDFTRPQDGMWRAMQLFEVMENGAVVPAGPFQRLPRMTAMAAGATISSSTLLNEDMIGAAKLALNDQSTPELPVEINNRKVARNYRYIGFRFLPDGSTNLPSQARSRTGANTDSDSWYVTVLNITDLTKPLASVNFATIMIDPFTGSQKVYRPSARTP